MGFRFSISRLRGLFRKEFIQLKRDRLTFAMLIGIPFMQLILFGYAINSNPRDLPTAVVRADDSVFVRSILKGFENTGYFEFVAEYAGPAEADAGLLSGEVQFVITIPEDFTRELVRGNHPAILLEADATDNIATSTAAGAAQQVLERALKRDLTGPLAYLASQESAAELRLHRRYNPEMITQYSTIPGLIGVILSMTLVAIMSMALARERERGTLENLYAMPFSPIEVMIAKILPFVLIAYVQVMVVLIVARLLFHIPFEGSISLLLACLLLFIVVNLSIGFAFSTFAKAQLQAIQMAFFFMLLSILLSGFIFPFAGMPDWAQFVAEGLPLTHFVRIVRGIMLKDAGLVDVISQIWSLAAIFLVVSTIALTRYRARLD